MVNKVKQYLRECRDELKKVTWPSRQQVVRDTIVVIGISLFAAAFFGATDYGLMKIFDFSIRQ
ncbi:preprotein translocase subunit SecE [Candidatus Uhrbacteria bacterium]|nr:preprotein translocase subunit SecE [Candidatus Uhrbacteria bacterium]